MTSVMVLILIALAASPYRPLPGDPQVGRKAIAKEVRALPDARKGPPCAAGESVARLPFARGRNFCSLDAYLAHLEAQGAIDLPWWREVRPGVYEQVKRLPGAPRETATRAELMKRFGFSR